MIDATPKPDAPEAPDAENKTRKQNAEASAQPPPAVETPPIESLSEGDDLSAFFSPQVGAELRKRALRAVFRQKRFNLRDGLDDYDEDYTAFPPLTQMTAELRKLLKDKQENSGQKAVDSGQDARPDSRPDSHPDSHPDSQPSPSHPRPDSRPDSTLDSRSDSTMDSAANSTTDSGQNVNPDSDENSSPDSGAERTPS